MPGGARHVSNVRRSTSARPARPPFLPGTSLQALLRMHDPCLAEEKLRFLCAANADRTGGSMGVRGWLVYSVYGLQVLLIPDPLDTSAEHQRKVEERLEDFAVWYAVCRLSGRQASHTSIWKYVTSVRA